ncbi:MAG: hypothetical protein QOI11_247 [Candidatus Eremiobacteraeota bacterium]|nr:hypothetical protein [Candidatus Eremiobacteraeota bacterium]
MPNFSTVRLVALALALLLTGAAPPAPVPPAPSSASAGVAVAVSSEGGHLFAEVRLDGSGPLRFAVDTSGGEIVDQAVAERLGLRLGRRVNLGGVGGHSEVARRLTIERVEVGGARLDKVRFLALPIGQSFGVAEGSRVDGIIGPALLARFTVTIDAAGGTMALAPRASGALGDLPLALDGAGHPSSPCTVAALPAHCQLDTGSRIAVSLMRPFLDAHPALAARATTAEGVQGYGIGGPARGKLGPVEVSLGGRAVSVIGDFTTQRRGAFADGSVDANLGEPLLRRFVVTYDLARGRARIVPSAAFDEPQVLDRSGLFLIRPDAGTTTVLDVRPGTPAASAGVRANDALVALDGTPAAALSLDDIRARLAERGGTRVVLRLRGAEGERDVTLTLANYASA